MASYGDTLDQGFRMNPYSSGRERCVEQHGR